MGRGVLSQMDRAAGVVFTCLVLLGGVAADLYMHVPRGSNNRAREPTATRTNANRMFDSQNNNRGGYNIGDKTNAKSGSDHEKQYNMRYFQSGPWKTLSGDEGQSFLNIEWTNQHGCGGSEDSDPQKQNCVLLLQYMCQDDADTVEGDTYSLRNGFSTSTPPYTNPGKNTIKTDRKSKDVNTARGIQENWDWYNRCYLRERNGGLFVADQALAKQTMGYSSAIHTRQNPTGNRYGYECPEERDYFPYWHPTPWVDVAVLADGESMCKHYQSKSFNVQPYHECIQTDGWSRYNNEKDCTENGGRWLLLHNYLEKVKNKNNKNACENTKTSGMQYMWAVAHDSTNDYKPECLVKLDAPACMEAPWSRSNHLGNGKNGVPLSYKWKLPYFPSNSAKRCVFRMRYNISTDDYDPYNTDHRHNEEFPTQSPIRQNPYVYVMKKVTPLRLAINTAQYGRIFQDRSHIFKLLPRKENKVDVKGVLHNLNVRGKRGNIVQTFPAVEYDFAPNELRIKQGEMVHIQWTGSNSHNNEGNGGDGQAGAAGEGKEGTDRHNLVEMSDRSGNFPAPFENTTLWDDVEVVWIYHGKKNLKYKDLAINMASSGYYQCATQQKCQEESVETKAKMSNVLDNAPASYPGAVLRFTKRGTYHFMCTRNNSFSNRSQKAAIIVE